MKAVNRVSRKRGYELDIEDPNSKRHAADILSRGVDEREQFQTLRDQVLRNPARDERAAGVFDRDVDMLGGVKSGLKGQRIKGAQKRIPCSQRASVTTIVKQGPDVHAERDENVPLSMRAIPLGSEECMTAAPGEMACARIMPRTQYLAQLQELLRSRSRPHPMVYPQTRRYQHAQ